MNQGLGERRFQDEIPFWREQVSCLKEAQMGLLAKKAAYHYTSPEYTRQGTTLFEKLYHIPAPQANPTPFSAGGG